MFVPHHFKLPDSLLPGEKHLLTVRLRSPLIEAIGQDCGPRQTRSWGVSNTEALRIRKASHSYGWDIMPRALSAGIWRSVELRNESHNSFREIYLQTLSIGHDKALIGLHYRLETSPRFLANSQIRVSGSCGSSTFESTQNIHLFSGFLRINLNAPLLWWPAGYGTPNLYDVSVEFIHDGSILSVRKLRFGIRTVSLEHGHGRFLFKINDTPVLVKGSNWVPADVFHSRDANRIEKNLELFTQAGCNMVRCWGGNVYEDTPFFDYCDRMGLMVWQDFAMACGLYPQDDSFAEKIRAEAVAVVRKLRGHASLVVWCGDNECDENAFDAGFDPGINRLTRQTIPRVLADEDPCRPYLPSSPFFTPDAVSAHDVHLLPERHLWGPRDYYRSDYYRANRAPFVSEIGFHGCPAVQSIYKFIEQGSLWPCQDNSQWAFHASDPFGLQGPYAYRVELMLKQILNVFDFTPDSLEEFALASQIVQAEAKKSFVEETRLNKWRRTGVIWWNMIDGWPQFSDAVVDYFHIKKLAFFYLCRVQKPFCIMISEHIDGLVNIVAGNDSMEQQHGTFTIKDADSGETLLSSSYSCEKNHNSLLGNLPVNPEETRLLLIQWAGAQSSGVNHALIGKPPFNLDKYLAWLKSIASLDGSFDANTISR